jgi:hypothetical protein
MAFISRENGPAMWIPDDTMQPVFEPKVFEDGTTRYNFNSNVNLCFISVSTDLNAIVAP